MTDEEDRKSTGNEEASREPSGASGSRSPSAWNRRMLVFVLAVVDFLLAGHLALYQWRVIDAAWDPVFGDGSHRVLDSPFSESFRRAFGAPDAALGAAAYVVEAVLALVGSTRRWRRWPWLVALFGANAAATALVGLLLVALQATVIGAWCLLCLVTAALSVLMAWAAYPEVRASALLLIGGEEPATD